MNILTDTLSRLKAECRLREIPCEPSEQLIDLSQNDYLSLGEHSDELREEFFTRWPDAAFSSSASRLLSKRQRIHNDLEDLLASLYGRQALLFNSGYHANVGCVGALALPSSLFICDKLVHASVVDGLRVSGAEFRRFPHNDMAKLRRILEKEHGRHELIVVVAESIYSMDGDEAPLRELVELKKAFPGILLYIDEAHAFGVRGHRGLGLSEELGVMADIDLIVGTLGKAAASAGAFAICSEELKSILVNLARPFIFSTALPPVNAAWSLMMVEKITGMQEERKRLAALSAAFSRKIEALTGRPTGSTSQIIPLLTGDAERAVFIAGELRKAGFVALPIRRPTVPPGGERIRFSLGADMTLSQLQPLFNTLESL